MYYQIPNQLFLRNKSRKLLSYSLFAFLIHFSLYTSLKNESLTIPTPEYYYQPLHKIAVHISYLRGF